MSALFSMMRNEFMPASRSLMPMQRPEKPAPTMRMSTLVTEEFVDGEAGSVMRELSLPCLIPQGPPERGETRRFRGAIGELQEPGGGQAARRVARRAKFSGRRGRRRRGRVRRGAWSHRAAPRLRKRG